MPLAPPTRTRGTMGTAYPPAWTCRPCGNFNYAGRSTCNARNCGAPYNGGMAARMGAKKTQVQSHPEGSWKCSSCGNINWPNREECNSCHLVRKHADGGLIDAKPSPDACWTCPACQNVNYPVRTHC